MSQVEDLFRQGLSLIQQLLTTARATKKMIEDSGKDPIYIYVLVIEKLEQIEEDWNRSIKDDLGIKE